jgi:hypothetical protein
MTVLDPEITTVISLASPGAPARKKKQQQYQ